MPSGLRPVKDVPGDHTCPPLGVVGVGHIANACARIATSPAELPASLLPFFAGASDVGVGHSAITWALRSGDFPRSTSVLAPSGVLIALSASEAVGVGHKPEAVPSVGRIDGTSRDNDRPAGVADAFQVSSDSVEPVLANRCRNLLSHEDSGPSGTGEAKQVGPQVPIVIGAALLSRDAEWLARRGAGPQLAVLRPAGNSRGECPTGDAREKVALGIPGKVRRNNVDHAASVDVSVRDSPIEDEVFDPGRGIRVNLVVVVHGGTRKKKNPGLPRERQAGVGRVGPMHAAP